MSNKKRVIPSIGNLEGIFIKDFSQAVELGESFDSTIPISSTEWFVGVMNDLEKALGFLSGKYREAEEILVQHLNEGFRGSSEEKLMLENRLIAYKALSKAADDLMWESIRSRFAHKNDPKSTGWGIRAGHMVVLVFGYDAYDPCYLAALGVSGLGDSEEKN